MPGKPSVRSVAPVKRDRVEDVPENAKLGEREHALDDGAALRAEADDRLFQRRAVAVQVVAIAKRDDVPAIAGDQGEPALDLRELVQIEQEIRHAIAERVAARPTARMHERAFVEPGSHHGTPSAAAARTPDASPSSWNP